VTSYLHRHIVPAAYDVLPKQMASDDASAMLIAIARQVNGPARGFWQFEANGGVKGVLRHPSTRTYAKAALVALCYRSTLTPAEIHAAIEHNDMLACVWARLLLWTLPDALAQSHEPEKAWGHYLAAWRPGKPHPKTWDAHYTRAWAMVTA
jgi:hypothetical protein